MINQQSNIKLAQQLANRTNRNVAIYTNSRGQVNIQYEVITPIEPFNTLRSVVIPSKEEGTCLTTKNT